MYTLRILCWHSLELYSKYNNSWNFHRCLKSKKTPNKVDVHWEAYRVIISVTSHQLTCSSWMHTHSAFHVCLALIFHLLSCESLQSRACVEMCEKKAMRVHEWEEQLRWKRRYYCTQSNFVNFIDDQEDVLSILHSNMVLLCFTYFFRKLAGWLWGK